MPVFDLLELPFCKVIRVGAWNDTAHRYFIAYRARNSFRQVLGLPVIDEFSTFSSPIFFAPIPLLGKIYNAGISLGHKRDHDMDIDLGWPPLCVGIDVPAPELPANWEQTVIAAIQDSSTASQPKEMSIEKIADYTMQKIVVGETTVMATDAPLIQRQLRRLCETTSTPFTLAFATGNRIVRAKNAEPIDVRVVSEKVLDMLMSAAAK